MKFYLEIKFWDTFEQLFDLKKNLVQPDVFRGSWLSEVNIQHGDIILERVISLFIFICGERLHHLPLLRDQGGVVLPQHGVQVLDVARNLGLILLVDIQHSFLTKRDSDLDNLFYKLICEEFHVKQYIPAMVRGRTLAGVSRAGYS